MDTYKKDFSKENKNFVNKPKANILEKDIKIFEDETGTISTWACSGLNIRKEGYSCVVCLNNGYFSPITQTKITENSIQHLCKIGSGFLVIETTIGFKGTVCRIYEVKYYDKIKKIAHLKLKDSYNSKRDNPHWKNGKYLVKCKRQIHASMNKAKKYYNTINKA